MQAAQYPLLVGVALLVSLALTPVSRAFGLRHGIVARPGGRSVHSGEVSRLGGVAIFAGFLAALSVQALGERLFGWRGSFLHPSPEVVGVVLGLAAAFLVGVIDDAVTLPPGPKLAGQVAAAALPVAFGLRVEFVANPFSGGLIMLGLTGILVTMVWMVGFANVVNLIDGLDGLAAGISAIAAASFLVLAVQGNHVEAAVLAAGVIGGCLGFLRFNFHPASVFMGDSGSLFLGFALASVSLLGVMKSVAAIALAVPLLVVWVPVFDTASAIIRRVRHGRPIQEADRGHIHHRLLGRGFDQRQTVLIIYVWSAALAVGGYAMRYSPSAIRLGTVLILAVLSGLMAYWLGLFEAAHHHPPDGAVQLPLELSDAPEVTSRRVP